jgi:two-component system cell cycle response regulator CtrA
MPRLLIVDDEPDVCGFSSVFFRKRGIDVFAVGSGAQALEILKVEVFDLILLDIRMKDISGVEVLREIRQRRLFTPVIILSGVDNDEITKELNVLGVSAFLRKPVALEELEKTVLAQIADSGTV